MRLVQIALFPLLFVFGGTAMAEAERPPWLSDEVMAAAKAIQLTPEQLAPFRENVAVFLESYRDQARKLVRRGAAGLEGQIHRLRKSLAADLDERMAETLTDEQMVPYADYRAALLNALEQR